MTANPQTAIPGEGRGCWRERIVPVTLSLIVILAGVLRFYGLAWGAPYFHFHIDEHFVFVGADRLRISMRAAAMSGKFFMYGPVPMHMLNAVVWVYESVRAPLVLTGFQDQVTYMVMGRAISATMGTATVFVLYFIGKRVSGRIGGLLGAALLLGAQDLGPQGKSPWREARAFLLSACAGTVFFLCKNFSGAKRRCAG